VMAGDEVKDQVAVGVLMSKPPGRIQQGTEFMAVTIIQSRVETVMA
jgi:hypothetical protein